MTEENSFRTYNIFASIVGMLIFFSLLAFAYFKPCAFQNDQVAQLSKVAIALMAGLLGSIIPGTINYDNLGIKAAGATVFVVIVLLSDPVKYYASKQTDCYPTKVYQVLVKIDDKPTENVFVTLTTFNQKLNNTNENGITTFELQNNNIPSELEFHFKYIQDNIIIIDTSITRGDTTFNHLVFLFYTKPPAPRQITGIVYSSNTQPVAGAEVVVSGTLQKATTDSNGFFSIEIINDSSLIKLIANKNGRIGTKYVTDDKPVSISLN